MNRIAGMAGTAGARGIAGLIATNFVIAAYVYDAFTEPLGSNEAGASDKRGISTTKLE